MNNAKEMCRFYMLFILLPFVFTACKPSVQVLQSAGEPDESDQVDEAEIPPVEDVAAESILDETPVIEDVKSYTVLTDPWSKYFRSEPKIYLLPSLSDGIARLLEEEQRLAKEILSNTGQIADRPEYVQLEDELSLLKTAVPGAETRSGYGRGYRTYPSYVYSSASASGGTAYIRSGSSRTYYTVFHRVHKSSSPDLARSVENIVYNARIDDLDQRIDALQKLSQVWSRKTNVMSPNGVEGVMREANMAYLDALKGYTVEWIRLQKRLRGVEAIIERERNRKMERLEQWQAFESNRLPVLAEYVERQHQQEVISEDDIYKMQVDQTASPVVLLACEIGERSLYFNLGEEAHPDHPFRLIFMGE